MITGALTGIARATAIAFAQQGASIIISGRREEEGRKLETELRELGAEAHFIRADVRHEDDVRNLGDAETLASFAEYVGQHSKSREDINIKSWFDALDLDDSVSFGGKSVKQPSFGPSNHE